MYIPAFIRTIILNIGIVLTFTTSFLAVGDIPNVKSTNQEANIYQFSHWYLGAKTGYSYFLSACDESSVDCEPSALAGGVFMGYQFNNWLSIEGGYDYFGKAKGLYSTIADQRQTVRYETAVQGFMLGLKADYSLSDKLVLFGKAGALRWHTDTKKVELSSTTNKSDYGVSPMLGGGIEYNLSKRWVSRLEYQWIHNIGEDDSGNADNHLLAIGLSYKFGIDETVTIPAPNIRVPKLPTTSPVAQTP